MVAIVAAVVNVSVAIAAPTAPTVAHTEHGLVNCLFINCLARLSVNCLIGQWFDCLFASLGHWISRETDDTRTDTERRLGAAISGFTDTIPTHKSPQIDTIIGARFDNALAVLLYCCCVFRYVCT